MPCLYAAPDALGFRSGKKSRLYNHRKKKPIKISSRCEQLSWVTGDNAADPLDLAIDESDSDFSVCAFRFHLISHMYCCLLVFCCFIVSK